MVHLDEKEQTTDHYQAESLQMEMKLLASVTDISRRVGIVTTHC